MLVRCDSRSARKACLEASHSTRGSKLHVVRDFCPRRPSHTTRPEAGNSPRDRRPPGDRLGGRRCVALAGGPRGRRNPRVRRRSAGRSRFRRLTPGRFGHPTYARDGSPLAFPRELPVTGCGGDCRFAPPELHSSPHLSVARGRSDWSTLTFSRLRTSGTPTASPSRRRAPPAGGRCYRAPWPRSATHPYGGAGPSPPTAKPAAASSSQGCSPGGRASWEPGVSSAER